MIAPTNCNPYCDCAQRLVRCQKAPVIPFGAGLVGTADRGPSRLPEIDPPESFFSEANGRPTVAEVKERLNQLPERRKIFGYEHGLARLSIVRESDGSVSLTVCNVGSDPVSVGVPAAQWRKMIGAFAIEPDLWPGAQE